MRCLGLVPRRGDGDALAGREPIRLDHDRQRLRLDVGLGGVGVGETAIRGGRNAVFRAEILGEAL